MSNGSQRFPDLGLRSLIPVIGSALLLSVACGTEPSGETFLVEPDVVADTALCADGAIERCNCGQPGVRGGRLCEGGTWGACVCDPTSVDVDAETGDQDVDADDGDIDEVDGSSDTDVPDADEIRDVEPARDTVTERDVQRDTSNPKPDTEPPPDADEDVEPDTTLPDVAPDTTPNDVVEPPDVPVGADVADVVDPPDTVEPPDVVDVVDVADVADTRDTVDVMDVRDVADTADTTVVPDVTDPCLGVSEQGECTSSTAWRRCIVIAGSTNRFLRETTCGESEECGIVNGAATCISGLVCIDGEARCSGGNLQQCVSNAWVDTICADGCETVPGGAQCTVEEVAGRLVGSLRYETLLPTPAFDGWQDAAVNLPAHDLLVVVYDGSTVFDVQRTGALDSPRPGGFDVRLPVPENGDERVIFFALDFDASGTAVSAVNAPPTSLSGNVDAGEFLYGRGQSGSFVWQWAATPELLRTLVDARVPITSGSGALAIHDYTLRTRDALLASGRADTPSVSLWWAPDVEFSCGACALEYPTNSTGYRYEQQVLISGGADQGEFASPVTVHEVGHVVMSHYGTSPNEGGTHYLGVPQHPGLAWSEGWATAFSSMVRDNPIYFSSQSGGMFWFDIDARQYGFAVPWRRATPGGGLLQKVDENEVAAMVYAAWEEIGLSSVMNALQSPRMNRSPFARGYTTRYWEDVNAQGEPEPWEDTGQSAPMFADFADALVCGGFISRTAMNAITRPTQFYPYNASSPLCDVPGHVHSPLEARLESTSMGASGELTILVAVERHTPGLEVKWDAELPDGVTLVAAPPESLPGLSTSDTLWLEFTLDVQGVPPTDLVLHLRAGASSWGWHTPIRWRFGRPEPSLHAIRYAEQDTWLWGRNLGPAVIGGIEALPTQP